MTVVHPEKSGFIIRNARVDELDEVACLLRDAYIEYKDSIPESAWKDYLADIMDVASRYEEAEIIVAETGKRLVGTVTVYPEFSKAQRESWPRGWAGIRLLAVHPAYRGRGIGRALMEESLQMCLERGVKTVGLHTTELMDVARRMYERMGFVRAPRFDFHPRPGVLVMAYRMDLNKAKIHRR